MSYWSDMNLEWTKFWHPPVVFTAVAAASVLSWRAEFTGTRPDYPPR